MFERIGMVFIYITVLCLLPGVYSEWSGEIKLFLDENPITSVEVTTTTSEIFKNVNYTALYQNCLTPPLPRVVSDPQGCDTTVYELLKTGLEHQDQFDLQNFLNGLWSSEFGDALVKYYETKGANISVLKNAFTQTWLYGESKDSETPFEKMFFGRQSSGLKLFNNWYTFAMHHPKSTQPSIMYDQTIRLLATAVLYSQPVQDLPNRVYAMQSKYTAKFMYPSHPYIDLIAYTLCYWISDEHAPCHVTAERTFHVSAQRRLDSKLNYYLYKAEVE